jgi:hypothetical protein
MSRRVAVIPSRLLGWAAATILVPSPVVVASPPAGPVDPRPVSIAFLGDTMLGRMVSEEIPQRTPSYFWGSTLPILL